MLPPARPRGRIKSSPEDFVVDEIPAYEPSGEGEHLYIHFRKRGLTTDDAVRTIARALAVPPRDVGVAGMKDKLAVTTQWISLALRDPSADDRARSLDLAGIEILDVRRHGNKLRTGHLRGNRFDLVVRALAPAVLAEVTAAFARIGREGVPNAFGAQRFGMHGDNAARAQAWLTGKERAPGDARLRRLHFSALQSAIFNAVLEARVVDGTWRLPIEGDLLKKTDSGGLFLCTDVQTDRERAERGEVCPTGPIFGDRMRHPEGAARAIEDAIAAPWLEGIDLARARSLGEGTRRPLELRVTEMSVAEVVVSDKGEVPADEACALRVCFVLPKGAYATTVLGNVVDIVDVTVAPEHHAAHEGLQDSRADADPRLEEE